MRRGLVGMAAVACTVAGCSIINPRYQSIPLSRGESIVVPADQRVVFSIPAPGKHGKRAPLSPIVCAEPSPDALRAEGGSFQASTAPPTGTSVEANAAYAEASQFIGLRTQSIQLLRDALYRACEAYADGALTQSEYADLARRYQKSMTVLLAVEQLTGTVRAIPGPVIGVSSSAAGGTINALTQELKTARDDKLARQKTDDAAQTAVDAATTAQQTADAADKANSTAATQATLADKNTALKGAQQDKQTADAALKDATDTVQSLEKALANASAGLASATPLVAAVQVTAPQRIDAATATAVADDVTKMVEAVYLGDVLHECLELPAKLQKTEGDIRIAQLQLGVARRTLDQLQQSHRVTTEMEDFAASAAPTVQGLTGITKGTTLSTPQVKRFKEAATASANAAQSKLSEASASEDMLQSVLAKCGSLN